MPHQSSQTHFYPEPMGVRATGRAAGGGSSPREPSTITCCCCCSKKTLHLRLFKEAPTNNPTNEPGDFGTAVDMVTVVTRAARTIPHRRRARRRVVSGSFRGWFFICTWFIGSDPPQTCKYSPLFQTEASHRETEGSPAPAQHHELHSLTLTSSWFCPDGPQRVGPCQGFSVFELLPTQNGSVVHSQSSGSGEKRRFLTHSFKINQWRF